MVKGIKPEKKARATSTKGHYVTNATILAAYRDSKEKGRMTDELGKCIMAIAENYSKHPWFCRYPFRDEMISEAIVNLCAKWHLFDETMSEYPNPFAYYTQACYRSFNTYKEKEKNESAGRDKLMISQGLNPSFAGQESDSSYSHDDFAFKPE